MGSIPTSGQQRIAGTTEIVPGVTIAGKFRVERIVGRGGMGIVVEATNVQLDQKVALKLLAARADDTAVVERFMREARAAARLRSEHIARVYDVGKDALHGPFIVMEYLEGKTLAAVISGGPVQLHRAVEYVIDACEGLAEAHARGIVHQDVKPANLFLVTGSDGRPSIKVLDFGIATMRTKEHEVDRRTSQHPVGTPAYLAPEQVRGAPADHRVDVWALGCVLYELLVGERPFRATRFTELVTKILESPPEPIPEALEIAPPVAAAIERCLEKDPAKRFASTGELGLALLPFARRRAHSSVSRAVAHVKSSGLDPQLEMPSSMPPRPSDGSIETPSSHDLRAPRVPSFAAGDVPTQVEVPASVAPEVPPAKRRRLAGALVALAVLLAGAAGLVVVWRGSVAPPRPSATSPSAAANGPGPTPGASPPPSSETAPEPEPSAAPVAVASSMPPIGLPPPRPGPVKSGLRSRPAAPATVTAPAPAEPPAAPVDTEIRHNR